MIRGAWAVVMLLSSGCLTIEALSPLTAGPAMARPAPFEMTPTDPCSGPGRGLAIRTVWSGEPAGESSSGPRTWVVRDEASWNTTWGQLRTKSSVTVSGHDLGRLEAALPRVDFNRTFVIGIQGSAGEPRSLAACVQQVRVRDQSYLALVGSATPAPRPAVQTGAAGNVAACEEYRPSPVHFVEVDRFLPDAAAVVFEPASWSRP